MLSNFILLLHLFLEVLGSNQLKLIQDMLETYDRKAKPTWDNNRPVNVTFSMDLYQLLELNEPQQYILLNAWIIERWHDEFLFWNPMDYGNITELRLPYHCIWLPDTTLYNSLVMKDDDTRRLLNAKLTTNVTRKAVLVELLYPTIYKFSCLLSLRFFPYDVQVCTMTFGSWTYDQKGIDYLPYSEIIGTSNFLENEGWYLLKTTVRRKEVKYACCPNKYTLLKLTLYLRRKPLFYLINLIIPTSIITLIAIVGFFTTSSASGVREEKVSLGITTLLSMSILMLMVSDQMPTTSTFIPLIGWFILSMIFEISIGTLASCIIIAVQKRGRLGERLSLSAVKVARVFAFLSHTDIPRHLKRGTKEYMEAPPPIEAYRTSAKLTRQTLAQAYRPKSPTPHSDESDAGEVVAPKRRLFKFFSHSKPSNGKGQKQQQQPNGISPDKSTDPLVLHTNVSNETVLPDESPSNAFASPLPDSMPPPPPPLKLSTDVELGAKNATVDKQRLNRNHVPVPLRLSFQEDNISSASDSVAGITPLPASARTRAILAGRENLAQARDIGVFNENVRLSRQLAQKEYEWLATIMERCLFIIFVVLFFLLTFGINLIGYAHWVNVDHILEGDPDLPQIV